MACSVPPPNDPEILCLISKSHHLCKNIALGNVWVIVRQLQLSGLSGSGTVPQPRILLLENIRTTSTTSLHCKLQLPSIPGQPAVVRHILTAPINVPPQDLRPSALLHVFHKYSLYLQAQRPLWLRGSDIPGDVTRTFQRIAPWWWTTWEVLHITYMKDGFWLDYTLLFCQCHSNKLLVVTKGFGLKQASSRNRLCVRNKPPPLWGRSRSSSGTFQERLSSLSSCVKIL